MGRSRVQHGLIQRANLSAHALGLKVQTGPKGYAVWRYTPTGWVWNADFADKQDAEDYLVGKLCQVEGCDAPR